SEATVIPGNARLSPQERRKRVELSWQPFHDAVEAVVAGRAERGSKTSMVAVHSFTPIYHGRSRPWHVGIVHDEDTRLATPLIEALQQISGVDVGVNEPYSPSDRVYHTLEMHARSRGLPCVMIEIRNDEIGDAAGQ